MTAAPNWGAGNAATASYKPGMQKKEKEVHHYDDELEDLKRDTKRVFTISK